MNHVLPLVNAFAASWADALVRACWQGGLAITLAWLICRLWHGMPPNPRCWLWRLAYAKLLLGLVWLPPLALPLLSRPSAPPPLAPAAIPAERTAQTALPDVPPTESAAASALPPAGPPVLPAPTPLPLPPRRPALPTVQTCLLTAWLLGVLVSLGRVAAAWRRARVLHHTSAPPADDTLRTDAADLCRRLRIRRVPPLRVADGLLSPLLLGLTRPAILLPAFVLTGSPRPELRLMLAHELAHLARRDLLWNGLPLLAQRLFFFHPLVWLAGHEWSLAQEIACDALAVELTETPVSAYARMLLGIATRRHASAASLFPTLAVAGSRHTLRRRLFAMQHIATVSRPRVILAAALVAAFAVGGLLPWRVVAQSGLSPSTPATASQSEATREKNIQKERANIASQNAQLDAQLAEIQKNLSPAQLKEVQPEIDSTNAMSAKQQQRIQLLEQDRAEYATTHPNRLSDEQIAFIRHFNWFQWKPTRIRANIRREQTTKRKLQAHLASTHDAHSRWDDQQQIVAIDQRRRQGEKQIRDWQPIIDRDRAQVALLPVEQSNRVAKLDSYDLNITVNKIVAVQEKRVWIQSLRRRLADKLSVERPTTNIASLVPLDASAALIRTPVLSLFSRHGTLRVRIFAQDATGRYLVLDKRSYGKSLIVPSVKAKKGVKINLLVYDNERVRNNWWF